jgi:hypothetical protein
MESIISLEARTALNDAILYLMLFMMWGALCGCIGYLSGATSKIAPYLKAVRALSEGKDAEDPDGVPEHR